MYKKYIFSAIACACAAFTATAADVEMCFSDITKAPEWYGTGKSETYDVAVKITDPSLVGAKIKGIKVPVPAGEGMTDMSGWMSKELTLGKNSENKKVNLPDIASAAMTITDGWLVANFDTPYEMGPEGVYVGYTFTVDVKANDLLKKPIAISEGAEENSFWLHTTKTQLKWRDVSGELTMRTFVVVVADAQFGTLSSGLVCGKDLYYQADVEGVEIPVEMIVHGAASFKSLDFTYDLSNEAGDKWQGKATKVFDTPAEVQFGHSFFTSVVIPETLPKGIYTGTLKLDAMDGTANEDAAAESTLMFETLSRVPLHKPVMEEYTGLWCGFCPRGYASLEHMRHQYPNDFIGISYHNSDDMMVVSQSGYPSKVPGFPTAYLDRDDNTIEAYGGTSGVGFGFKQDWLAKRAKFTPIDVRVITYFDPNDPDLIHAETQTTLVKESKDQYKIAYVLLADGLTNRTWIQSNNYAGNIGYLDIPEMEVFVYGSSGVSGLVFNDILVGHSNLKGEPGALPELLETDVVNEHMYDFRVSACKNVYGYPIIQHPDKLRVAALVLDPWGHIANADCKPVCATREEAVGIDMVSSAAAEVVSTRWYDFSGAPVANPASGLYIKVCTYSDGSRKSFKVSLP